jgi:hypothetical protein
MKLHLSRVKTSGGAFKTIHTGSMRDGINTASANPAQVSDSFLKDSYKSLLDEWISLRPSGNTKSGVTVPPDFSDEAYLDRSYIAIYKDIYMHDYLGGSAVDMLSNLPFSDVVLSGGNPEWLQTYYSAIKTLKIIDLLPRLSVDKYVTGSFIGSLLVDTKNTNFLGVIPHRTENCEIKMNPVFGEDPYFKVYNPKFTREFANDTEKESFNFTKKILGANVEILKNKFIELSPLTTLYVPNKDFSSSVSTSIFRRMLPIYILEKLLFRGTLYEANRRQRSVLHIQMGDGDDWIPTQEELSASVELFRMTDQDPVSAIIATRTGVDVSEVISGGDFWKYTDLVSETEPLKLKSLGMSDSFLSGDQTIENMEASISVFNERLIADRRYITEQVFYRKLFPLVSVLNNYTLDNLGDKKKPNTATANFGDSLAKYDFNQELFIPNLRWEKSLRPSIDENYMDILETLEEKGFPIGLSAYAAASGSNIDQLIEWMDTDAKYKEKIEAKKNTKEEGGGDDDLFASVKRDRNVEKANEIVGHTKTGKKRYIMNQKIAKKKQQAKMAKAIKNIASKKK